MMTMTTTTCRLTAVKTATVGSRRERKGRTGRGKMMISAASKKDATPTHSVAVERKIAHGAMALGAIALGGFVHEAMEASTHVDGAMAYAAVSEMMPMDNDGADELFQLAGGEVPFWANMVKYARFSISIMVGFAFMFGRPIVALMKKPQTAVAVVAVATGGYYFFKFTIETMLGMNDPTTLG
jgi:hypothetical protein